MDSTVRGELGGGGDVAAEDAAGDERLGDGLQALPGGEHVEDDAVDVGRRTGCPGGRRR